MDGSDCSILVVGVVKKVGVVPNCDGVHGGWVWPRHGLSKACSLSCLT